MRIALLTLPSVMSDEAALAFLADPPGQIVLVGLSDPMRRTAGGVAGQLRRHLARSGPRILPYLALGFGVPGRRRAFAATGLPVVTVADVNDAAMAAALDAARPDLLVTLHFDQILAPITIARAPRGGINLHPSMLPRHRGPIPAFWALAEGGTETGVSIHRLVARIDAGAVLGQRRVALPAGLSALEAARRLHLAGLPLLRRAVARLAAGETLPEAAPAPLPYCPFPDAAALREAARRGVRLARLADLALLRRRPGG